MSFDKKAYQREYMARQRASQPTSRVKRLEAVVEAVKADLASSNTEKGKKLYAMAVEALS